MINKNAAQIEHLKNVINNALDPLITSDYCLLDIPNHKNIGDNLIWAGEFAYLQKLQSKMLYTCNMHTCDFEKIPEQSIILLHGGGNFGDVWRLSQNFKNNVVKHFKKNKIIILPQTVHYSDKSLIEQDAAIFSSHPDLTICARDNDSYSILEKSFSNNTVLLVPDMAFYLDFSANIKPQSTGRKLLMRRTDRELNNSIDKKMDSVLPATNELEIKDWPTYNFGKTHEIFYNILENTQNKLSKKFFRTPVLKNFIDHRYGLKSRSNLEYFVKQGIDFINNYDEVYSTRLHGAILSILLNKTVHIIDNSYGKNKNFYNAWLTSFNNTYLISN